MFFWVLIRCTNHVMFITAFRCCLVSWCWKLFCWSCREPHCLQLSPLQTVTLLSQETSFSLCSGIMTSTCSHFRSPISKLKSCGFNNVLKFQLVTSFFQASGDLWPAGQWPPGTGQVDPHSGPVDAPGCQCSGCLMHLLLFIHVSVLQCFKRHSQLLFLYVDLAQG